MITIISMYHSMIIIGDVQIKPYASVNIELSSMAYGDIDTINRLYLSKKISMSLGDYEQVLAALNTGEIDPSVLNGKEDKSNKVLNLNNANNITYPTSLAVKTAIENSEGGGNTGVTVVEYDKELNSEIHEIGLDVITVMEGSSFNPLTGDFTTPEAIIYNEMATGMNLELKYGPLNLTEKAQRGTIRVDLTETTNSFDIIFLTKNSEINLNMFMRYAYHDLNNYIPELSGSSVLSLYADNSSFNVFAKRYINENISGPSASYSGKIFDLVWGTELEVQAQAFGMTVEEFSSHISTEQLEVYLSQKVLYVKNIDSSEAHLFYLDTVEYNMYFVTTQKTALNNFQHLDEENIVPFQDNGKIKIEFLEVQNIEYKLPTNLNDGTYVYVKDSIVIDNDEILSNTFLLLYDDSKKYIKIKQ